MRKAGARNAGNEGLLCIISIQRTLQTLECMHRPGWEARSGANRTSSQDQDRLGASQRSASSLEIPRRATMSSNWSSPIFPTLKYLASGCAK